MTAYPELISNTCVNLCFYFLLSFFRVQFFDLTTRTWQTPLNPTNYIPTPSAGGWFINLDPNRLFFFANNDELLEYKQDGQAGLWTPIAGLKMTRGMTLFYTMDYFELLI